MLAQCSTLKRDHLHLSIPWVFRWELFQRNTLTHPQKKGEPPRLASLRLHFIIYHLWSTSSGLGSLHSTLCALPHLLLSSTLKACATFILILQMRKLKLGELTQLISAEVKVKSRTACLQSHCSSQSLTLALHDLSAQLLFSCYLLSFPPTSPAYCISFLTTSPLLLLSSPRLLVVRSISQHLWNTYSVPSFLQSDSISLCFCFSIMPDVVLAEST